MSDTNGGSLDWRVGMLEAHRNTEHNRLTEVMADIRSQSRNVEEVRKGMGEVLQQLIVVSNRLDMLTEKLEQPTGIKRRKGAA